MNEFLPPLADPPPKWKGSPVITCDPGTRWYVESGPSQNFKHWLRELHEYHPGNLIPMQWVPQFVGVTRGAVKQRLDAGGLTAFSFVVKEAQSSMLGKRKYRETRYRFDYMVIPECEAWRDSILERTQDEKFEQLQRENKRRDG
jgi:hypothetical protein